MSILNVTNLSHGFGDRAIFHNVSFRLLKGEHIGLIGANGEGKSTFMNIVTGKLMPDEGKVEWSKHVHVGYLDQHAVLERGMTLRSVLQSAFSYLFELEERMNLICDMMGEAEGDALNEMIEELGTIQELLSMHDFYIIDSKVEEIAHALGLDDIGLDTDVADLSGGQRTKLLLGKLLLEKPDILLLDEPTNYLDVQHIEWLKRYLTEYENAFILISHDIPFLNSVVNIIYHMENQELNRYVGNYDKFLEVYEMKKRQLEAAYNRQQKESRSWRILLQEIKPGSPPVIWLCPDRRSWIRWKSSSSPGRSQSRNSISKRLVQPVDTFFRLRSWSSVMMSLCPHL
jgi:ATPase subunit of ABC transporter with duplicated ATPase domains